MTDGRDITSTMNYDTLERMLTKTYPHTIYIIDCNAQMKRQTPKDTEFKTIKRG